MTLAVLAVLLGQASPEPEVFIDRGETYVRMGYAQGLTKGVTLDILAPQDRNKVIGTAVVMEVWDGLARVNLDTASSSYKGPRLAKARPVAPPPMPSAVNTPLPPGPAVAPPPPAPGSAPGSAAASGSGGAVPGAQRQLHARVQISGGLVDARRFIIYNIDSFDWHNCKIRLPDGRGYDRMEELRSNSDEGIMMFRFEPGMALRDPSGLVTVYCAEGAGRFAPQF